MDWLVRALLLLAPAAYRERYGESVIADFRACLDDMRRERRLSFLAAAGALADLARAIFYERVAEETRYLAYALRSLARTPGFTLAMVFTLALGLGANVAAFTIINGALLKPLPFPQADRMVAVWTKMWINGVECAQCSSSLFTSFAYDAQNLTFESLAPYTVWSGADSGGGPPIDLTGAVVGAEFLNVLGMGPQLGRGFAQSDEATSTPDVAMISDTFWLQRYHRDPSAIGQDLVLDGKPVRIIGIMPRDFLFPNFSRVNEHPEIFLIAKREDLNPSVGGWGIIGRLRPKISYDQAALDLDRIVATLDRTHPGVYRNAGRLDEVNVVPLIDDLFGPMRIVLLPLFGAVCIVLLIACVNAANLLIARAVGKEREIAMRLALGASTAAIVREVMTEAFVLSFAAVCLGLVGAYYAVQGYVALHPAGINRIDQIAIDGRVVVYAVAIAVVAAVSTSVLPALVLMHGSLFASLREGRSRVGSRGSRVRSALVVVQIACAFSLVVGCGLLVRSLQAYADVDLGFTTTNLVAIEPAPIDSAFLRGARAQADYFDRLRQDLAAVPGVAEVAYATAAPLSNEEPDELVDVVGGPTKADALFAFVSSGYFSTMGVPIVRGRAIDAGDGAQGRPIAVVNQEFVRRFMPNRDPIGRQFVNGPTRFTVVGVVQNATVNRVGEKPYPAIYFAIAQLPTLWDTTYAGRDIPFIVRLRLPLAAMSDALLSTWRTADPREPIPVLTTMTQLKLQQTANTRANAFVLGALALVALLLAISGTASVAAYSVARRTSEIGLRMALGATRWGIVNMLLRGVAFVLAAGLVIGLLLAAVSSYALRPQLFGTPAFDPVTYAVVAIILVAATTIASFIPAYSAASIEPAKALRYE